MGSSQMAKLTKADALDEFKKWAIADLQRGQLNTDINGNFNSHPAHVTVDTNYTKATNLVDTLLAFGSDIEIITEAVHSSSQTIDSRHFAEEFIRRKAKADKGIVEPSAAASPNLSKAGESAWSSVAKKGQQPAVPVVAEPAFKMAKAKGRRK